jgi:acyl-CoA dehydrogenase
MNSEKKFITSGMHSDYFTVAARTGAAGNGGISLFLVERGMSITSHHMTTNGSLLSTSSKTERKGLDIRKMKTQGAWVSGTAYLTFEDVKVPHENLIGTVNNGFKIIMYVYHHI